MAVLGLPGLLALPAAANERAAAVPGASALPSCAVLATRLSLPERIGQMIMVAQDSQRFSPAGQRAIRRDHIGSVVLLGNSSAGVAATRKLTNRLRGTSHPAHVSILLATDQEGGLVQRLRGPGFSRIPSAVLQARQSDATLRTNAARWGRQLAAAGIDVDLAPVADVVPKADRTTNAPIGRLDRWYASTPLTTSHKNAAFIAGMHTGKVAATAKHFPGLGRVTGNTDTATRVVDTVTTRHDRNLGSFRNDVRAGVDLVMMSSATYQKIDRHHPAVFSRTVVIDMLRTDLDFHGVVISDDLFGRVLSGTPVRQRGVRFVVAGGDLALVGDPSQVDAVYGGLRDRARTDAWFRRRIDQSVTRILSLKATYGLADCTPVKQG